MIRLAHNHFLSLFSKEWKQGEHLAIVGPTGSGKTVWASEIQRMRHYLIVIATKERDESLHHYRSLYRSHKWPVHVDHKQVLYWKKPNSLGDFREQRFSIYNVLSDIYKYGGWSVYFDDLYYVSETLRLKDAIRMLYTQARSNNITLIASIQRPFWVPTEALSQSTYCILFKTRDKRDIKRISDGLSIPISEIEQAVNQLKSYESVFLQTGKTPIIIEKKEL